MVKNKGCELDYRFEEEKQEVKKVEGPKIKMEGYRFWIWIFCMIRIRKRYFEGFWIPFIDF